MRACKTQEVMKNQFEIIPSTICYDHWQCHFGEAKTSSLPGQMSFDLLSSAYLQSTSFKPVYHSGLTGFTQVLIWYVFTINLHAVHMLPNTAKVKMVINIHIIIN